MIKQANSSLSQEEIMADKYRQDRIVNLLNEHGFLSVAELSQRCTVTEMTIRRDLLALDKANRIRRVYGGAAAFRPGGSVDPDEMILNDPPVGSLLERVDVLIATSVNPKHDGALLQRIATKNIPIIAESQAINAKEPVVAVDNYQAGLELGHWAAEYALQHDTGKLYVLDLTTHLTNASLRSRGFIAGLHEICPDAEILLSIDTQSRFDVTYQLTLDALTVYPQLNLIFAINDTLALGAVHACRELHVSPDNMLIIPFGLEGDTLKDLLTARPSYIRAGIAMFPEIVGPCCIEAAIAAFNHQQLPAQLITPHIILNAETLHEFYIPTPLGWQIRWDEASQRLQIPLPLNPEHWSAGTIFPKRIGFIIPFSEHEWYKNLTRFMSEHARCYRIDYEIVDIEQNLKDEVEERRRLIAELAAQEVHSEEVIFLDGGPIANYLAEILVKRENLTIITNSMPVFEILRRNPANTLISTGGAYRSSSQVLVGPPAEATLRGLRADKLFLMISGISLNFGLSHTNISEVTIKQAMIHSSREVILLADTTYFAEDSLVQVAPLNVVHKLITDDALPASIRLDLNKIGIQILLADGR
jgi:DeoR/GlpR family transcriptional regulator of sugar metabolism/ABC-type sugar transport system substrate-binding protein